MMYKIIRESYGNFNILLIKPQYIFSTDDTVVYIFEGCAEDNDKFTLVSKKLLKYCGNQSKYTLPNNCMMQGMRVKLTFSFSTVGTCAPLFITVTGLNERNFGGKKHILVRVKGLCIGG